MTPSNLLTPISFHRNFQIPHGQASQAHHARRLIVYNILSAHFSPLNSAELKPIHRSKSDIRATINPVAPVSITFVDSVIASALGFSARTAYMKTSLKPSLLMCVWIIYKWLLVVEMTTHDLPQISSRIYLYGQQAERRRRRNDFLLLLFDVWHSSKSAPLQLLLDSVFGASQCSRRVIRLTFNQFRGISRRSFCMTSMRIGRTTSFAWLMNFPHVFARKFLSAFVNLSLPFFLPSQNSITRARLSSFSWFAVND